MKKIVKRILTLIIILILAAAALWAAAYFHRSDPKNIIHYETTNPFQWHHPDFRSQKRQRHHAGRNTDGL